MRFAGVASLTDALLVAKGAAAPSRPAPQPPQRRRARSDDGRLRVGLRLDEPRHRRLRLAAAHFHKTTQAVMLAALDHYLDRIVPITLDQRCECLGRGAAVENVVPLTPHAL
jgi:hypothetical protein